MNVEIQWINLNRHVIEFTTLSKGNADRIMAGQNDEPEASRDQIAAPTGILCLMILSFNSQRVLRHI